MSHLLKVRFCENSSLLKTVALAIGGSSILYLNADGNSRATVALTVPEALRDLLLPWRAPQRATVPRSLFPSSDYSHGRVNSIPSGPELAKEATGEVGSSSKCCAKCLGRDTIANAAASVGPAVVNISVPLGFNGLTLGESIGSGTIIDTDGTILTCAHVVMRASSKKKVHVTLQDGRTFEGTVVNADLHSDIAIIKIESTTPLPAAKLGSSSKLRPGDWVVAMGCPLSLQNTVTAGVISCVDRKSSDLGLGGMRREFLQTDCAINMGNSGGPLVNIDGEVVGVNFMKVLAADGLNFSVPIDSVSKIIEQFKKSGRVIRPWLGLKMVDLNDMIISQLKERDAAFPDVDRGVLLPVVVPGSPADRAGFHPGDVVIEFDGKPVSSIDEIVYIMGDKVGVPMKVVVRRSKNSPVILTVVPEEANPDM